MTKELGQNNKHIQTLLGQVRFYNGDVTTGKLEIIFYSKIYTRIERDGPGH